jgi:hypothetical protein
VNPAEGEEVTATSQMERGGEVGSADGVGEKCWEPVQVHEVISGVVEHATRIGDRSPETRGAAVEETRIERRKNISPAPLAHRRGADYGTKSVIKGSGLCAGGTPGKDQH